MSSPITGSGDVSGIPNKEEFTPGLGGESRDQWPRVVEAARPIDGLRPGSDHHRRTLRYLMERLHTSEHDMSRFYSRWRANELRLQAWIDLPDWEQRIREANAAGRPPKAVNIVIPYMFATQATIATYMLQVFTGKKPYFNVGTYGTNVESALKMEVVLQYQADHVKLAKHLHQFFSDWQTYGVAIMRTHWKVEKAMRTIRTEVPVLDMRTGLTNMEQVREQEERTVYEGNVVEAHDPFMFFPDPRVPMHEVAEKGEYVFWRMYEGKHELLRGEREGRFKWVNHANQQFDDRSQGYSGTAESARDALSGGIAHPGLNADSTLWTRGKFKVDQGSIHIIPRELGLSASEKVELWLFTVLNNSQIIQAERLVSDHNHHPVCVIEPLTMGYSFGAAGMSDYLGDFQDSMSWFMNSHMDNVRKSINDVLIYDPAMIQESDLKKPEPGKRIRVKPAAIGRDVRTFVHQLSVNDVTRGHVADMQQYFEIGQRVSAVTDNLLGLQDPGGRKTATEIRTSSASAASRLATLARVISAQGMTELTYQMSLNTQQNLTDEFYVRIVGQDGLITPLAIGPDDLTGDFHYPIHDGTLPLDKVALFDLWRQMLEGVLQDPELRSSYSVPKIFEFAAELGGAKNIQNFRIQQGDPNQIQQQAQAGNLAPIPGANSVAGLTSSFTPQGGGRLS